MLRKVHLHGSLKGLHPEPLVFDVDNTRQLLNALNVLVSGFEQKVYALEQFHVVLTDDKGAATELTDETLTMRWSDAKTDVHVAPQVDGGGIEIAREVADSTPSFLFNGAANVQEQGYMLPLIFGIHMTGSVVASASTDTDELPIAVAQKTEPAGGGTPAPSPPAYVEYYEPTGGA